MRDVVRASDRAALLTRAQRALDEMIDAVSAVARDDADNGSRREKAAEFMIHLRSKSTPAKSIREIVNRVAEAAAKARYRSGRIVDFLSTWLFVVGEQFIDDVKDPFTAIELELAHPAVWGQVRTNILETLEAGAERMKTGRRFRLAEHHLARFRLVRARNDEKSRATTAPCDAAESADAPDYVASMIVDMFALSLSDLQQRLLVSQIPNAADDRAAFDGRRDEYNRLWIPLRAVRTDQAFSRWKKLRTELDLAERQALLEMIGGMTTHLRRSWSWFFPDRLPFGPVRATLDELEEARRDELSTEREEETIERLFGRYREALSFLARLATEDCESGVLDLANESGGGVL